MCCDYVVLISQLNQVNSKFTIFGVILALIMLFVVIVINDLKIVLMSALFFFIGLGMIIYGVKQEHIIKEQIIQNFAKQCKVNKCDILYELSIYNKDVWLNKYYKTCIIKGGGE